LAKQVDLYHLVYPRKINCIWWICI